MTDLQLTFKKGHLFVELEENLWLFDTGAPTSFGTPGSLDIADEQFSISPNYFGLSALKLSEHVGVECAGLLGADILGHFDHILDVKGGRLAVSKNNLSHDGEPLALGEFMGIPILTAKVGGRDFRMFFDTGAQISYFQDDSITKFPAAGSISDFYPGFGQFKTETHHVAVSIGATVFTLRCGRLPGLLSATLMMANTQGIVGNEVLMDRVAGFFPRRGLLYL